MADILRITFEGKVKETGEVFEKKEKCPVILGEKQMLKGFEDAVSKMKAGEGKKLEFSPDQAFGARSPDLVKLIPMKVFKDNGLDPKPGSTIYLESGLPARVQSVSGGRVRVDFNHPLANKTLLFDVKVDEIVSDRKKQMQAIFETDFPTVKKEIVVEEKEGQTEIKLPKECNGLEDFQARKIQFITQLKKLLKIEKIKVSEEF